MSTFYPAETVDDYGYEDKTMPENVTELANAIVGHKIVSAGKETVKHRYYDSNETAFVITLDNGKRVILLDDGDCCAYTDLESFLLHPDKVDHMIMGVGTTDGFTTWHIYADFGDILELTVGWSPGSGYYGYGFDIRVEDVPE